MAEFEAFFEDKETKMGDNVGEETEYQEWYCNKLFSGLEGIAVELR